MRTKAILLSLLMATFSLAGCFGEGKVGQVTENQDEAEEIQVFVTDKTGASIDAMPLI